MSIRFAIGDEVQPTAEWRDDANLIPTGRVVEVERWGRGVAVYVDGERRAFADYVFEMAPREGAAA